MTTLISSSQTTVFGKHAGSKLKALMATTAMVAGVVVLSTGPAAALPKDPTVVGGTVDYKTTGKTLTATQTTKRAYTLWGSFDASKDEKVIINQPSRNSLSVNKVTGNSVTNFNGALNSNGNVWILNQNGVVFGKDSQVNVGGLLASTGDVSVSDVMDGDNTFKFSNFGNGELINEGTMNIADAGLAAFVGPFASNQGVINAKLGTVAFAAGEQVTIDMYGDGLYEIAVDGQLADALLENTESGKIDAEGGTVLMTASAAKDAVDNIINMDGVVSVASATVQGGKIILSGGGQGAVKVAGVADASGGTDGGTVSVTGQAVEVEGAILADAGENGNGGTVDMIGTDKAILNGYVSARGGSASGNGGQVELSAMTDVGLGEFALVDTTAANGEWGTFTIDPADMILYNGPNALPGAINADTLGLILYFTDMVLAATNSFTVAESVDISEADFDYVKKVLGVTVFEYHLHDLATGNLSILAPTVNIDGDVTIGSGNLNILSDTTNLNGKIYGRDSYHGPVSLIEDDARLGGASTTINMNNAALIQQAISFMADFGTGKTINVGAGAYDGGVLLNKKNVALIGGAGAFLNTAGAGTGVLASADGTEVSGFTINGGAIAIHAQDVDGFAANNNIFSGQSIVALNVTGTTQNVDPLVGNVFSGDAPIYIRNTAANADIDASDNTYWGLPNSPYNPSADVNPLNLTNLFELEDRTLHVMDDAAYGSVQYVPGTWFVTEDSRGIQAAVDAASGGNSIYVQAGNYSESVDVNKTLNLYGANAGIDPNTGVRVDETFLFPNSPGFHVSANGTVIDGFSVVGASDGVFVDNVSLVTVSNNIFIDSSANGVRVAGGFLNTVENNSIDGFDIAGVNLFDTTLATVSGNVMFNGGSNGVVVRDTNGATIAGNDISDVTDNGVRIQDSANIVVDANVIGDADDNGVQISGSNGITVSNNTLTVAETGVDVSDSVTVAILDNTLNGHDDEIGVKIVDSSAVVVSGNTIDDYETGVDATGGTNVTVANNTITSVDYGVIARSVAGLNVIGNTMTGNSVIGVWAQDSDGAMISGNGISDFDTGIFVDSSDAVTVSGNTVENSGHHGIKATDSNDLSVLGNTVTNSGTSGFLAGSGVEVDGGTGITVAGNTIDGASYDGIGVRGASEILIAGNIVSDTTDEGMDVDQGTNVTISNNIVTDAGDNGLEVEQGDDVVIRGNSFTNSGWHGLNLYATSGLVVGGLLPGQGNTVSGTHLNGVNVIDSAGAVVAGNTVSGTGENGIYIDPSPDSIVSGNSVTGGTNGIVIDDNSDNSIVRGNTLSGQSINGVLVTGGSDTITVALNTVTGAGETGIRIDGGDGHTVLGNTIDGGVWGILLDGTGEDNSVTLNQIGQTTGTSHNSIFIRDNTGDTTVALNTIANAGWDGINLSGGTGFVTVQSNTINNTVGASGIAVLAHSGDALIDGNTIDGADHLGIYVLASDGLSITDNTVNDTGREAGWWTAGIHLERADDTTVTGNTVTNTNNGGNGIHIGGTGNLPAFATTGNVISGNVVYNTSGDGVEVTGSAGVQITNNAIGYTDLAGTISGAADNVGGEGIDVNGSDDAQITGNKVTETVSNGISLNPSSNVLIDGNIIDNTGADGVNVLGGDSNTISNNLIGTLGGAGNIGANGIGIDGSTNAIVTGNVVNNTVGNGIFADNGANDILIQLNTVDGTGAHGVQVNASNGVTIDQNTVGNTGADGITVANGDDIAITDNGVTSTTGSGISQFTVTNSSVTGNTVGGTGDEGIVLRTSDTVLIDGNTVSGTGTEGVDVGSSTNVTVNANTIDNTGTDGIYADNSAGIIISGNLVGTLGGAANIGDEGIDVNNSAGAQITGNTVNNTVSNGISINPSPNSLIFGNTIANFGAGAYGIYVLDSDGSTVDDNDISFGGTGIRVESSENVQVTNNTMNDIDIDGIQVVDGSHGTNVQDNVVSDTSQTAGSEAVIIEDSNFVTVLDNTVNKSFVGIAALNSDNLTVDGNAGSIVRTGVLLDNVHTALVNDNGFTVTVMGVAGTVGIDAKNSSDLTITANALDDFIAGVRVVDSATVDVDGNTVTDANFGILADTVSGLSVTNNTLDGRIGAGKGTVGIQVIDSAGAQIGSEENGNTVSDFNAGIRLENSGESVVEDNTVTEFATFGIRVIDSALTSVNINTVDNDGGAGVGISVETSNESSVTGNDLDDIGGNGIQVIDSHDVLVSGNTLDNIGGNGIWIDPSDNVEIAENILKNIVLDGVRVDDGTGVYIHDNNIQQTGDDGIDVNGNNGARIESNTVLVASGEDSDGIEVDESNGAHISENVVGFIANNGIVVLDSDSVTVELNRVFRTGTNGIYAEGGTDLLVDSNIVSAAGEDGIHVQDIHFDDEEEETFFFEGGPLVRIVNNTVTDTDGDGIEVYAVDDSLIDNNVVGDAESEGTDIGEDGVKVTNFVEDDPTVVSNNIISNVGDNGIEVTGIEEVTINNNTVNNAGENGIYVDHFLNADIFENVITNVDNDGIFADGYNDEGQGYSIRIADNTVDNAGADGIQNGYTDDVTITGNTVTDVGGRGIDVYNSSFVEVSENAVSHTGDHGIAVRDSGYAVIADNTVDNAGFNSGVFAILQDCDGECEEENYADGIHVQNVLGYNGGSENWVEGEGPYVSITGNTVDTTEDDGIEVIESGEGDELEILVYDGPFYSGDEYGADGISVRYIRGPVTVSNNIVYDNADDGVDVSMAPHVEILDNTIFGNGGNGVEANRISSESTLIIAGNLIEDNAENGIEVQNSVSTEVIDNIINNNGAHGLFMRGAYNHFVTLSGNVFTGNPVGARFESGEIDLTGEGNIFNFGDVALQFAPAPIEVYPDYDFQGEGDFFVGIFEPEYAYAPMSLVNDTIGAQFFNGQSTYFVELDNGAFFDPGQPTVLDATDSTFVTPFGVITPSATGNLIGANAHAFLETRFFHYVDDSTLGLFFFGDILSPEIDQEDIFRTIGRFRPFPGAVRFTLNGLPFVDPALALALAALAPAAGGTDAEDLAGIEPAAGGDDEGNTGGANDGENAHCWADAVSSAGQGVSVNYNFGSGLGDTLADAAGCSSPQSF